MVGALLEVEMSKKCTPLWREANFEVKMYKTPQRRTTFGSLFFSVRRLLGFRQVVAQVRPCLSELCRNVLSLLIGSIKREHGPLHSPVAVHRRCHQHKTEKQTKPQNPKHHTQKQPQAKQNKNHRKASEKTSSYWTRLLYSNSKQLMCWRDWALRKTNKQTKNITLQGARGRCKSKTSRCGNPGSPSHDPGDHNETPTGHNRHLHPSEIAQCKMNYGWEQQQAPCRGVPSEEMKWDVKWNLN